MSSSENKRAEDDQSASWSPPPGIPHLRVADLLGSAREAILEHEGQLYRLRITSNRKLILTK
jgi:hemin uptake protein HemP